MSLTVVNERQCVKLLSKEKMKKFGYSNGVKLLEKFPELENVPCVVEAYILADNSVLYALVINGKETNIDIFPYMVDYALDLESCEKRYPFIFI